LTSLKPFGASNNSRKISTKGGFDDVSALEAKCVQVKQKQDSFDTYLEEHDKEYNKDFEKLGPGMTGYFKIQYELLKLLSKISLIAMIMMVVYWTKGSTDI
jgi:hypothetical protein